MDFRSISPWYEPADVNFLAHVHLQWTFAMVQYIIVAAEEMLGEISDIYDPLWMIIRDCASIPLSIHNPSWMIIRDCASIPLSIQDPSPL